MADIFTKAKRSAVMSRIRGRGNKDTELALIRVMRGNSIKGWRRNHGIHGKPDFVFSRARLAVFVDGCFWHQCPLHSRVPANNHDFWVRKLARNKERDRLVNRLLRKAGWRVIRIWEHELARKNDSVVARRIQRAISVATIARGKNSTRFRQLREDC